uniref:Uncharacterized protein n=1 Tax=Palpitomonas bilix TaxID=652834 RepID=A0A7S3DBZ8_9EUKA|mmetsp:Transcript_31040/g.81466  ORF Transcript_31040/g.81466 Transcript_31040/m.81466 type:complete len:109 (+) Transcript_31040:157-483(+)
MSPPEKHPVLVYDEKSSLQMSGTSLNAFSLIFSRRSEQLFDMQARQMYDGLLFPSSLFLFLPEIALIEALIFFHVPELMFRTAVGRNSATQADGYSPLFTLQPGSMLI